MTLTKLSLPSKQNAIQTKINEIIDEGFITASDIPPIATSVDSSSTNAETVGAKLFYDTCGDIETLINAL